MRQSKDHYAILFGISLVLITFLLILDIQTGLNLRGKYLPIPKTPNPIQNVPVQMVQSQKKLSIANNKNHGNIEAKKNGNTFDYLEKKIGKK